MTGRTKFEQMLEHLVNEDTEKAQELFHQIVVEKSREIYENILSEDFELEAKEDDEEDMDEAKDEEDEESVEEAKDEDEEMDEDFAFGEADDDKDDTDAEMDMDMDMGDEGDDEMDMGDEGSDDLEDRVVDLEDAIDDLRAEFEKMMGDEDMGDDDMGGDIGGPDGGDMGDDLESDITMKMGEEDDMFMREYVEKVGGADYTKYGKMGDNGANTKSIVAGKNDMGGTSENILRGGESTTGGTKGGLANPTPKDMNTGNINVPGGNAGKTAFKKKEPGHGAEKKSTGDNGDRGADSPINGVKSRAK